MAHDPGSTDDDTGDEMQDFESFLREKDKQWSKPPVEMKPTDRIQAVNLDQHFEIKPVSDAVENSSLEQKSTETEESIPADTSKSASDVVSAESSSIPIAKEAVEYGTELKLHSNPITGPYVSEDQYAWQIDEESRKLFENFRLIAITKMTPEQIIERRNKLEKGVRKIRWIQQALQSGLSVHFAKMSEAEQVRLHELDRRERAKNEGRTKIQRIRKSDSPATKDAKKNVTKSAMMKVVDNFKKNGLAKDWVLNHLRSTKRLDSATQQYIDKLVWES